MSTKPNRHPSLPVFIAERQELVGKTDQEISERLGFSRYTIYAAIKAGTMKLPVSKVPALAKVLDTPASELLTVMLQEQSPDLLDVVRKIWMTDVTTNERKLIDAYRHLANGRDVEPTILDGKNVIALITA